MRRTSGGIPHVAAIIEEDLEDRDMGLEKSHIKGLADLAASILATRSVNTSEIASVLPREVKSDEERYRYIQRWLSNPRIDPIRAMKGFVPEMMEALAEDNKTVILMLDQSKIRDGFECLMVSARVGERAVPVVWRVVETKGEIGFSIQQELLKALVGLIPKGVSILLTADRFYGTANLIRLCKQLGWSYRIRLKGNLILLHEGGEIQSGEMLALGISALENATLNKSGVTTNIGVLQEEGYKEAWIIAMNEKPSKGKILDYEMRWGIEALFSDMKTRGFGITKTHLKDSKRIEKLLLVLSGSLLLGCFYRNVSEASPLKKKEERSLTSYFKEGLRRILKAIIYLTKIEPLWKYLNFVRC